MELLLLAIHKNCRKLSCADVLLTDSLLYVRTFPCTDNCCCELACFKALLNVCVIAHCSGSTLIAAAFAFCYMAHCLSSLKTVFVAEFCCLNAALIFYLTACCEEEACVVPSVTEVDKYLLVSSLSLSYHFIKVTNFVILEYSLIVVHEVAVIRCLRICIHFIIYSTDSNRVSCVAALYSLLEIA